MNDQDRPPLPSEKSFGLWFGVLFAALAAYLASSGAGSHAMASLAAAMVFATAALLKPSVLRLPNRLWFRLGMVMHKVVNPIVMGAIFFLVMTPMALILRLAGRDSLNRAREPGLATYWRDRDDAEPTPDSFDHQF